jgi:hypothetical protein
MKKKIKYVCKFKNKSENGQKPCSLAYTGLIRETNKYQNKKCHASEPLIFKDGLDYILLGRR